MKIEANNPDEYVSKLPEERKEIINELRLVLIQNLPEGFAETMNYGMIGYVVPHSIYPNGYHCDTKQPLPFINLASQKNFIALYHMGLYSDESLLGWFKDEYANSSRKKLDMGKSCIRFKKMDEIPVALIGELAKKMTVSDWINIYEKSIKR